MPKIHMRPRRIRHHTIFWLASLALFVLLPLTARPAVFGYFFFLVSVYTGRWIGTQEAAASWVDMVRMFFLGLLTLSLGGLAIFASYVEEDLELLHYLESWINIFCFGSISVLGGFFTYRIRQKIAAKTLDKRAVGGQKM